MDGVAIRVYTSGAVVLVMATDWYDLDGILICRAERPLEGETPSTRPGMYISKESGPTTRWTMTETVTSEDALTGHEDLR